MKYKTLSGALALVLATAALSHASLNGVSSSPLGDHSSPSVRFANWDLFSLATFTNLSGDNGDAGFKLSQSVSATPPYGPQAGAGASDNLFYTFTKATNWTISDTASIDINTVVFQIKISTPASGTVAGFFTTTLNGISATPVITATGVDPGGLAGAGYNVLQWTWTDLGISSGQSVTINFSSPAGGYHVAVDSIAVDVTAVPEPSTYGIAAALFLTVAVWRRRVTLRNRVA